LGARERATSNIKPTNREMMTQPESTSELSSNKTRPQKTLTAQTGRVATDSLNMYLYRSYALQYLLHWATGKRVLGRKKKCAETK